MRILEVMALRKVSAQPESDFFTIHTNKGVTTVKINELSSGEGKIHISTLKEDLVFRATFYYRNEPKSIVKRVEHQ